MSRKVAIVVDVALDTGKLIIAIEFSRFTLSQEVYKESTTATSTNKFTGYRRKF